MLRVGDQPPADQPDKVHHLAVDKKKRQVTLNEPSVLTSTNSAQERAPMVSAPKMFAFDSLFTSDDSQVIIETFDRMVNFLKRDGVCTPNFPLRQATTFFYGFLLAIVLMTNLFDTISPNMCDTQERTK
jgi:hypothetical protein